MTTADWAALVTGWFPHLADTRLRQTIWPQIAAHHEHITAQLKLGLTRTTIHQRVRDERALTASVASLKRYVAAKNRPKEVRRDRVAVLPDEANVPPGEKPQSTTATWVNGSTRRRVSGGGVWAFAMVLASSRHMFVRPILVMDQRAWTEAHVEVVRFFGGVPRRLVPDNLRTGVDR
jgi:hypothetical protein